MFRRLTLCAVALAACAIAAAPALAAGSPTVTGVSAGSIMDTSVTLRADIDPGGLTTVYSFQFGLTASYGLSTAEKSAGHGAKAVSTAIVVRDLLPGTLYHYRVVAENTAGQTVGSDHAFRTAGNLAPGVATGAATGVARNGATLTGVVYPNNQATTYEFEYGTTTSYGSLTAPETLPKGITPVTVAATIAGLQPGALFHFQILAVHSNTSTQVGGDATFVTEPFPRPEPSLRAATTPKRAKRAPYRLTTTGKLTGYPSLFPPSDACTGTVKVRLFDGGHREATGFAGLQSNCTFSLTNTLKKLPGHGSKDRTVKLKVLVYFNGNAYVGPRKASAEYVTLGR
jgi:hypothetical protein